MLLRADHLLLLLPLLRSTIAMSHLRTPEARVKIKSALVVLVVLGVRAVATRAAGANAIPPTV